MALVCACAGKKEQQDMSITWNQELLLPPCAGMPENKGLAGAYAGILGGELVVAGGANFPDAAPWEGGTKVWWPTLYRLSADGNTTSIVQEDFLSKGRGYGVSIQLEEEILCIGGCDKDSCYAEVFSLVKNDRGEVVRGEKSYPSLPVPLANAAGTLLGTKVYLAGGQETMAEERATQHFFCLDLQRPDLGWHALPSWPGLPRAYAVCAAQQGKVYLFSGRSFAPGEEMIRHEDAYVYDPEGDSWAVVPGRFPVMAGTAVPYAGDKILLLGGVPELLPTTPHHPGFSRKVLAFDVKDHSATVAGESPYPIAVTCHTVMKGNTFYIASGEIRPGVRTPHILKGIIK